ncbi:MAG: hypothetical protein ACTSYC_09065 [Promethearchaeota archaeon]
MKPSVGDHSHQQGPIFFHLSDKSLLHLFYLDNKEEVRGMYLYKKLNIRILKFFIEIERKTS